MAVLDGSVVLESFMSWAHMIDLYFQSMQEHMRELRQTWSEICNQADVDSNAIGLMEIKVHAVKGASSTAGFVAVTRVAAELEDHLRDVGTGRKALDRRYVDHRLAGLNEALNQARQIAARLSKQEHGDGDNPHC